MAACLESNSSYKIVSKNGQNQNKSLFLVKLTDSCLKTLEQLQNPSAKSKVSKSSANVKPSIRFKNGGKTGTLFIPSKNGGDNSGTRFNFMCANLFMVNNTTGLDCLQQNKGDDNLALLGNITEKITVSANNDSYEATRNKMAEVEKERQGSRAKVIELKNGSTGVNKKRILSNQRPKFNMKKVNVNSKIGQNSSRSLKGLREKVIHLLALRSCNKLELRMKLEKEGAKLKDPGILTNILQQVSAMQDNVFVLNRHLYSEVQVDTWPGYTDEDREMIKNKLVTEMGSSVDRLSPGPLGSSLIGSNSAKRPLSVERACTNPVGKKPRIAHTNQNTTKNDLKRPETSPPKLTAQPARAITSRRESKEKNKTSNETNKKIKHKDTTERKKETNGSQNNSNDSNNNNCLFSKRESPTNDDYISKYPDIKTYEQRCAYKEDFAKEYTEFTETKERLDLVTKQFNELKERLKQYAEDSPAAKELQEEIFKVYEEKKERWTTDRQRLNYLYPKLSHIKKLVIEYDQAHFGTS